MSSVAVGASDSADREEGTAALAAGEKAGDMAPFFSIDGRMFQPEEHGGSRCETEPNKPWEQFLCLS